MSAPEIAARALSETSQDPEVVARTAWDALREIASLPVGDTERMEWLERHAAKLRRRGPGGRVSLLVMGEGDMQPGRGTVRDAVDAAMRGSR